MLSCHVENAATVESPWLTKNLLEGIMAGENPVASKMRPFYTIEVKTLLPSRSVAASP